MAGATIMYGAGSTMKLETKTLGSDGLRAPRESRRLTF